MPELGTFTPPPTLRYRTRTALVLLASLAPSLLACTDSSGQARTLIPKAVRARGVVRAGAIGENNAVRRKCSLGDGHRSNGFSGGSTRTLCDVVPGPT